MLPKFHKINKIIEILFRKTLGNFVNLKRVDRPTFGNPK